MLNGCWKTVYEMNGRGLEVPRSDTLKGHVRGFYTIQTPHTKIAQSGKYIVMFYRQRSIETLEQIIDSLVGILSDQINHSLVVVSSKYPPTDERRERDGMNLWHDGLTIGGQHVTEGHLCTLVLRDL